MRLQQYLENKERVVMSKKPIEKLNFPVPQKDRGPYGKPMGLWYGFGSSWIDWVNLEMTEWKGEYFYHLTINEGKIIQLHSYLDLAAFTEKWYDSGKYSINQLNHAAIRWDDVAKKYSGIEINPYIWKARYEFDWYYGWDVASGCIWKEDGIKSFERIEV